MERIIEPNNVVNRQQNKNQSHEIQIEAIDPQVYDVDVIERQICESDKPQYYPQILQHQQQPQHQQQHNMLYPQQHMPQQNIQSTDEFTQDRQGQNIIVVPPGQQVIIVQETQEAKPVLIRQERVGWCCFSVHNQSCCCDYYCMQCCCQCIQSNNLFCYCPNCDCVFYCLGVCVNKMCESGSCIGCLGQCCAHMPLCMIIQCCKDQGCIECIGQCCTHMPLCMLIECCKDQGCGECICGCIGGIGDSSLCECLGGICQIFTCLCACLN